MIYLYNFIKCMRVITCISIENNEINILICFNNNIAMSLLELYKYMRAVNVKK